MAGENLYTALQGLNITPSDTMWGVGTQAVAQAAPQLINPYGSVKSNLGIALGGTLLTALGAYQARKQAAEDSLQANRIGLQLQQSLPEERLKIIEGVDDSLIQERLLGLNTQLTGQEGSAAATLAQAINTDIGKQKALAEFYKTPEGAAIQKDTLDRLQAESLAKGYGVTERSKVIQDSISARQEKKQTFDKEMTYVKDALSEAQKRNILDAKEAEDVRLAAQLGADLIKVSNELEELSYPEIKLMIETGINPSGKDGLIQKIQELTQQYRQPQFGASLTPGEQAAAKIIFGSNFLADKQDTIAALRNLAETRFAMSENIIKTKQADLPELYTSIRRARSGAGFILPEPKTREAVISDIQRKQGVGAPAAPDVESQINQLEAVLNDPNTSAATKQMAAEKIEELLGQ